MSDARDGPWLELLWTLSPILAGGLALVGSLVGTPLLFPYLSPGKTKARKGSLNTTSPEE